MALAMVAVSSAVECTSQTSASSMGMLASGVSGRVRSRELSLTVANLARLSLLKGGTGLTALLMNAPE
jgi:hypothetical protein